MASKDELADEAMRARKVRHIVDIATNLIMQSTLTRREAEHLVGWVRQSVLSLFPDGEQNDRAPDWTGRVVVMGAANRLANRLPKACRRFQAQPAQ